MNFNFRFASVLKVRRHQKKREKQKLGILLKNQTDLERQMMDLQNKCRASAFEQKKQSVVKNRRLYTQKHALHRQMVVLRDALNELNGNIQEQRSQLTEAVKRVRMLEKLEEQDKRAFINRVEHVEQLQQNEIAIQRFNSTS